MAHILPRRLRMSSSTPGERLLCCELVCLTWSVILDPHEVPLFWKPEADLSPLHFLPLDLYPVSALLFSHLCAHDLRRGSAVLVTEATLFISRTPSPAQVYDLPGGCPGVWMDVKGTVLLGTGLWRLEVGQDVCEVIWLPKYNMWDLTKPPNGEEICEKSLSWSRHLKLLSFTQVSNPRDSKWKRTEFRIKVSKLKMVPVWTTTWFEYSDLLSGLSEDFQEKEMKVPIQICRRPFWSNWNNCVHQSGAGAGIGEGKKGKVGWLFSPNSAGLGHRRPVCEVCLFLQKSAFAVWPWVHTTWCLWALVSYW